LACDSSGTSGHLYGVYEVGWQRYCCCSCCCLRLGVCRFALLGMTATRHCGNEVGLLVLHLSCRMLPAANRCSLSLLMCHTHRPTSSPLQSHCCTAELQRIPAAPIADASPYAACICQRSITALLLLPQAVFIENPALQLDLALLLLSNWASSATSASLPMTKQHPN
jgi:hypothetical protein